MSLKRFNIKCDICGDKAVGRNFGAITCESCKVFFRRNACNYQDFKCRSNTKNCLINKQLRKSCKYCRLNKSFAKGMKTTLIRSKAFDSKSLDSNEWSLSVKSSVTDISDNKSLSEIENSLSNNLIEYNETNDTTSCEKIKDIEVYVSNDDNFNDNKVFQRDWPVSSEMLMKLSINSVFRPIHLDTSSFNEMESMHFSELFRAFSNFKYNAVIKPSDPGVQPLGTNVKEVYRVCNKIMDWDIKVLIKFSKNLSTFNYVCPDDQLALIKYGAFEVLMLRYTMLFDIDTDHWTWIWNTNNPTASTFKLDLLKYEKHNLYAYYKSYFNKVIPEWSRDFIIIDLLTAIVLFNPNRPNLMHRDVIKAEQQLYIYLLQRYLYLKYGSQTETQTKLCRLMDPLIDLQIICDIEIRNGYEFYLDSFGPILKEILYDITIS